MERIHQSFSRQGFMKTLGAEMESVEPGKVTLTCPFADCLTQQHGLLHGGVVASLADVACGYAALSMMPSERDVLTVEFKIHFWSFREWRGQLGPAARATRRESGLLAGLAPRTAVS